MAQIEKDLIVPIEDHLGNTRYEALYRREFDSYITVPRHYGIQLYGLPDMACLFDGTVIEESHLSVVRFELYDAQRLCIKALRERFFTAKQMAEGSAGCVLNLACGKGKTHIGIQRIKDVGRRTIVVCHSNVSVSQWRKNIARSLPRLSVSEFHGGGSFPTTDVVIATIHPLVLPSSIERYDKKAFFDWISSFGHVIYDEIHIFGSPKFSLVFDLFKARAHLGLSATPERSDGMNIAFRWKIGPILDAKEELNIAPPTFEVTVYPITATGAASRSRPTDEHREGSYAAMVKTLTLSESRVAVLIETMKKHFREHQLGEENMLIFCNYIEEVNFLFDRLVPAFAAEAMTPAAGAASAGGGAMTIGRIYENVDADAISLLADTARILICTYKKGGTAFSPIRFRSIVIWSPTRAMVTQAVGRVQRWRDEEGMELGPEGSWNALPRTIYDFADTHTIASQQYYNSSMENGHLIPGRRRVYLSAGYRIHSTKETKEMCQKAKEVRDMFASIGLGK